MLLPLVKIHCCHIAIDLKLSYAHKEGYSHSIVPGGLFVMSYTTRLTLGTLCDGVRRDGGGDRDRPVADATGDGLEKGGIERVPFSCHTIRALDSTETDDMGMCASVALYTDGSEGEENGKGLPDVIVETEFANGIDVDLIDQTQRREAIVESDISQNAHSQTRTRKGMTFDEMVWNTEEDAQGTNLVLYAQQISHDL